MKKIYLSPHLDDAVFSCGGLIWEQTRQGHSVEIWTICAGDPPGDSLSELAAALHQSWRLGRDAVAVRREEDRQACQLLGAAPRQFHYLDCIYRKNAEGEAYYQTGGDLFGGLDPGEGSLVDELSRALVEELPEGGEVIVPLGIGNHVDHELTRKAASRLGRNLLYYADYPYAREGEGENILTFMKASSEWKSMSFPVSQAGQDAWLQATLQYGSQIATFWKDETQLKAEIQEFCGLLGGMTLWKALEE